MQSKATEVMASGFNGASNAMAFSMDSNLNSAAAMAGGNGLGPVLSQVPSKKLNNLKRRILMKRSQFQVVKEKIKYKHLVIVKIVELNMTILMIISLVIDIETLHVMIEISEILMI